MAKESKTTNSLTDIEATPCDDGALEANMTVANMIEIVVVLAILYVAYRFFQKRS